MAFAACVRLFSKNLKWLVETWVEATRSINTGTCPFVQFCCSIYKPFRSLWTLQRMRKALITMFIKKGGSLPLCSLLPPKLNPHFHFTEKKQSKWKETFSCDRKFSFRKNKKLPRPRARNEKLFLCRLELLSNTRKWVEMFTSGGCGKLIWKKWNLWLRSMFSLELKF